MGSNLLSALGTSLSLLSSGLSAAIREKVASSSFGHAVCDLLGLDPRAFFQREVRPDRILKAAVNGSISTLTLTQPIHSLPSVLIIRLLEAYPGVRLSVVRPGSSKSTVVPKSIFRILWMAMKEGEAVTFLAEGAGAREVLDKIQEYNQQNWCLSSSRPTIKLWRVERVAGDLLVREILKAMDHFRTYSLLGIYHLASEQLILGRPEDGHGAIAKAAGFEDQFSYTRLNFEFSSGILRAFLPAYPPFDSPAGGPLVEKWLGELFSGVSVRGKSGIASGIISER